MDPYSEYKSGSSKLLNTVPIWIRIHDTELFLKAKITKKEKKVRPWPKKLGSGQLRLCNTTVIIPSSSIFFLWFRPSRGAEQPRGPSGLITDGGAADKAAEGTAEELSRGEAPVKPAQADNSVREVTDQMAAEKEVNFVIIYSDIFSFASGRCPSLLWGLSTLLDNDSAAHQDHCGRRRIRSVTFGPEVWGATNEPPHNFTHLIDMVGTN